MTNLLGTTTLEDIFIDEDKAQHEGGDDEPPHEGEGSGIHLTGGLVDEVPAGDELFEDPILVGVDDETGPRDEQPQVVVLQQAVTGVDGPPELCEYEKLRERNIRERDEAMKEAMEGIEEAKQDIRDNDTTGAKRSGDGEEVGGKSRKKKNVQPLVEVRRSGRERKPVSYVVDEDLDGRSRKRRRPMGGGRTTGVSETPLRSGQRGKTIAKPDLAPSLPSSSPHTRHPCKHVGYSEVPDPEADSFIWCSTCRKEEYNSCEKNITYFGDNKEFKLEVGKSSVGGRVMGVGVVNRGEMLPEGVLFGPYTDKFITAAKYKEMKKAKNEARNSWEIRDTFINKTVPYTDPVTKEQNLAGFQLAGQNYYRVIMNIPFGKELLVWYGETYAEEMGIEVGTVGKNTCEEDLTKEAVK